MKKNIYQKPTLKMVTVQQQQMICVSGSATPSVQASINSTLGEDDWDFTGATETE